MTTLGEVFGRLEVEPHVPDERRSDRAADFIPDFSLSDKKRSAHKSGMRNATSMRSHRPTPRTNGSAATAGSSRAACPGYSTTTASSDDTNT
jgi:hypothetical protein